MVMDTMQIRMNSQLVKELDKVVKLGFYANRSDVIRDAVRRFIFESQVGSISGKNPSVKEIRELRKRLSADAINLNEINQL